MKLKKIFSVLCVVMTIATVGTVTVSADEAKVGDVLGINNDNSAFSELISIENGKAYLPLRLVFPNLNDTVNKIGMKIDWENDYSCIHLIYGETSGEGYIRLDDNKTMTPFVDVRHCVDISWVGDAANGVEASLTVMDYTYDENGEMKIIKEDGSQVLDDLIYLKNVEGGNRMFASIQDINKIAELIGINGKYSVKLYK